MSNPGHHPNPSFLTQVSAEGTTPAPVVWVTGSGAKRVGRTVAEHFARNGYRVALHARSSLQELQRATEELSELGPGCMATTGDIRSYEAMEHATAAIRSTFKSSTVTWTSGQRSAMTAIVGPPT